MRIAVVHAYPVHSRAVGGTTRLNALVRHLASRHELHVFAHGNPEQDGEAVRELSELGVQLHLFPLASGSWVKKASWAFGRLPYFVHHNRNPELEEALVLLDQEQGIDVVHVELMYLERLLGRLRPECARVLAEQELMSVSVERLRSVPFRHKSAYQHYIALELPRIRRFEAEALHRFDRVFAINEREAGSMATSSGREVEILPHVVDTKVFTPGEIDARETGVLFVGNYGHHPNVAAAFWLMEEVWPRVKSQLSSARVRLVGPGLDEGSRRALEALGAEVKGRVEDIVGAYRSATVFANPIRSGGGMRGKVLEAFACGLPLVSTQCGLEGIAASAGEHCETADTPEGFADALLALLRDGDARRARGERARALVTAHYDAGVVMDRLDAVFAEVHAERQSLVGDRR